MATVTTHHNQAATGMLIGSQEHEAIAAHDFAKGIMTAINKYKCPDGQPVQIRIGMASGTVYGMLTSTRGRRYVVYGEPIRRAQYLQEMTTPDTVMMDASTAEIMLDRIPLAPSMISVPPSHEGRGIVVAYQITGDKF